MVTTRAFEGSQCVERRGSLKLGEVDAFKNKGNLGLLLRGQAKK